MEYISSSCCSIKHHHSCSRKGSNGDGPSYPLVRVPPTPQKVRDIRANDPSEIQAEERLEIKNLAKTGHGSFPYKTTHSDTLLHMM
jgi:hypothetical protein